MTITDRLIEQFRCPECDETRLANLTPNILLCHKCKRAWIRTSQGLKGKWGDRIDSKEALMYETFQALYPLVERIEALERLIPSLQAYHDGEAPDG